MIYFTKDIQAIYRLTMNVNYLYKAIMQPIKSIFDLLLLSIALFISISCTATHGTENAIIDNQELKIEDQIKYLRDNSTPGEIDENGTEYEYLVDYVRGELLERPEFEKHLIDKRSLKKLKSITCLHNYAIISDIINDNDRCRIEIESKSFKVSDQKIVRDSSNNIISINGNYPYGEWFADDNKTVECITNLSININGEKKWYRIDSIVGLYDPNFCESAGWNKKIEVYENGNYIYVYIQGGNAAGTYYSKLIFDYQNFITSITVDYYYLSVTGSFSGAHFIGF